MMWQHIILAMQNRMIQNVKSGEQRRFMFITHKNKLQMKYFNLFVV